MFSEYAPASDGSPHGLDAMGKVRPAPAARIGPASRPFGLRVSITRQGEIGKKSRGLAPWPGRSKYPLISTTKSVSSVAKKLTDPSIALAGTIAATARTLPSGEFNVEASGRD